MDGMPRAGDADASLNEGSVRGVLHYVPPTHTVIHDIMAPSQSSK